MSVELQYPIFYTLHNIFFLYFMHEIYNRKLKFMRFSNPENSSSYKDYEGIKSLYCII
jgi:hypothetical protein